MYRSLMLATLIATATAAPLEAQGRGRGNGNGNGNGNHKETRVYVDGRGRECRETTHYKKNGNDKYDLKCKAPKGNGQYRRDDRDDDDRDEADRDRRGQDSRYPDTRYPDRRYPDSRYPDTNNPDSRYPDSRYPDTRTPDSRHPDSPYPVEIPGAGRFPRTSSQTLPLMSDAVAYGSGRRTSDVSRWLGNGSYSVRYADSNRDGRPERASWLDGAGRVVQQWVDTNGDGRADQVRVYRDGQLARVIGR